MLKAPSLVHFKYDSISKKCDLHIVLLGRVTPATKPKFPEENILHSFHQFPQYLGEIKAEAVTLRERLC